MRRAPLKPAVLALSLAAGLVAVSCGGDGKAPTQPERLPNAAALIPAAPAPQPTPTPTPGAVIDDDPAEPADDTPDLPTTTPTSTFVNNEGEHSNENQ